MIRLNQVQIDETLLDMTIELSRASFQDGGLDCRSFTINEDKRDLILAALSTLMSQRRQNAVMNRQWMNMPEDRHASQNPGVVTSGGIGERA